MKGTVMTSELRRPLDGIANSVGDVGKFVAEASKSTDRVRKSVDALGKRVSDASAMQSVDLLTDEEVDELRKLVSLGDGANKYVSARLEDEAVQGMYLQLSDLGFIHCFRDFSGGILYTGYDPKANWAIARHDKLAEIEKQKKMEAETLRKSDRKHQRIDMLIGFVGGIVAALVISYITALAIGFGIPMV